MKPDWNDTWTQARDVPVPGRKHLFKTERDTRWRSPLDGQEYDEAELIGPNGHDAGMPNGVFYRAQESATNTMARDILENIWSGKAQRSNHPGSLWPSELDHVPVGKRYDPESKGWR